MRMLVVKLLFHLRHELFLQSSIELAASLNVRLLCLKSSSILAGLFLPDNKCYIRSKTIWETRGNPKREWFLTEVWKSAESG